MTYGDFEFTLFVQPICNFTGNKVGVECLARSRKIGEKNWQSPVAAIEQLTRDGDIEVLDLYMFAKALEFAASIKAQSLDFITVNISVNSLSNPQLVSDLIMFYRSSNWQHGVRRICIEITETEHLNNLSEVKSALEQLHRNGIALAIDDFGSGHNCFGLFLCTDNVSMIKFGHQVTSKIAENSRAYNLLKSLSTMATNMGVEVVYEGIETVDLAELASELPCAFFQGYALGKPQHHSQFIVNGGISHISLQQLLNDKSGTYIGKQYAV